LRTSWLASPKAVVTTTSGCAAAALVDGATENEDTLKAADAGPAPSASTTTASATI
jgi:hypothetical protein